MNIFVNPPKSQWRELCRRVESEQSSINCTISAILSKVKEGGDRAIKEILQEIDGTTLDSLAVTPQEIECASNEVDKNLKDAIVTAAENIAKFHAAQRKQSVEVTTMEGVVCKRRTLAIDKVGLYIPGGSAPLFSTLLMLAIPAKIAGCKDIILCTPCNKEGKVASAVLYAAKYCGVDKIYKVGGAQAIAAMAYGTETIPQVYKIFGPGNRYVTGAKQQVSAQGVAIDMPAGPSEVMILADESANAAYVAADMLSQAEHGADSQAMAITLSETFAQQIKDHVQSQLAQLPRYSIAAKALEQSRIIVVDSREDMVELANLYGAEHLIISVEDPWEIANQITAAGSIFVGNYSPESAGDYASGTNHTLPTMGLATAYSGIGLESFMHSITYQELSQEGLNTLAKTIITMAEAEGLDAHANAVKVRINNN